MDALDKIELENKSKKFEIIKVYTSHYILGLKVIIYTPVHQCIFLIRFIPLPKAIIANILQEFSIDNSDEILREFQDVVEYGEHLIEDENIELKEMANVRGERQKSVLLEKVRCRLYVV